MQLQKQEEESVRPLVGEILGLLVYLLVRAFIVGIKSAAIESLIGNKSFRCLN